MRSTIREVQPEDAPAITRLIDELHGLQSYPLGPRWTPEQVREECQQLGWVVLDEHLSVVAFVLARDLQEAWEISFLGTRVGAQRHGLMTDLLSHLIQQKPAESKIWLEVHELNLPARKFYEKAGFTTVGTRPGYYSDGGAAVLYNYG